MLGYTREELLTLHVSETYIPEERDMAPGWLEQLREGKPLCVRRSVQRKDATILYAEIRGRKMSETRYLTIIEKVPS
jgi:PAS domain-containing protein